MMEIQPADIAWAQAYISTELERALEGKVVLSTATLAQLQEVVQRIVVSMTGQQQLVERLVLRVAALEARMRG